MAEMLKSLYPVSHCFYRSIKLCVYVCAFMHVHVYHGTWKPCKYVESRGQPWMLIFAFWFHLLSCCRIWNYRCMLPCPALFGLKGSELVSLCLWGKNFTHWAISLAPENLVGSVKIVQLQTKNSLESELALHDLKVCTVKMCMLCVQNQGYGGIMWCNRQALPETRGALGYLILSFLIAQLKSSYYCLRVLWPPTFSHVTPCSDS